jgi:hypothetical protein
MSRNAVSWEHFVSFAHFEDVSFPSNPRQHEVGNRPRGKNNHRILCGD